LSFPQITTVDEASQFYPLFGLGANVALIFSGRAVKIFSQIRAELPPDVDGWGLSLRGLMGMVVIGGLLISGASCRLVRECCPVTKFADRGWNRVLSCTKFGYLLLWEHSLACLAQHGCCDVGHLQPLY
jgi:ATP/ADP translocase